MKKFDTEKARALYAIYVEAKKNCPYFGTTAEISAWTRKKNRALEAYDKYMECGKYCNPECVADKTGQNGKNPDF